MQRSSGLSKEPVILFLKTYNFSSWVIDDQLPGSGPTVEELITAEKGLRSTCLAQDQIFSQLNSTIYSNMFNNCFAGARGDLIRKKELFA